MAAQSRSRKPPSLHLSLSSRETSPDRAGDSSPDFESDMDVETASTATNEHRPAPPNMFPAMGSFCFKQPTLAEVLSNTAPPPFTLPAFMAYLSQNHCLETLEFTMDASRYRKHYNAAASAAACHGQIMSDSKECAFVRKLWQKLLDAYIAPNGPREVNLPCTIRDKILSIPNRRTPPPPEALDPAVSIIEELMQESVLVPFLSECRQTNTSPSPMPCHPHWNRSDESIYMRGTVDERILRRSHKRSRSPPSPVDFSQPSRSASPFSVALGWHSSGSRSQPSSSSWDSMMIDDSGSSSSSQWGTPMTPPTTPPMCEGGSPKTRGEKGWKRMTGGLGRGLGFGRKKSEW